MALSGMRGLSMFISDVRNTQNREQEKIRVDKELANIRTKFKAEKGLTPYEKKKYVWKMLYIYMLGYDVDFGHMEAVSLISAQKYGEKQVGYIVTAALLNENHDFLRLVINTVRNDIVGRNETFQCLALTLVANIGGREFSESLAPDVQKLLISNTCRPLVRKKAALCLLRLYRKNPDVVNVDGWAERMGQLLDERDLGVLTAVMSLLLSLVASSPTPASTYAACLPKCVRILERLTRSHDVPQDYTYYGIPSPWLQVKALRTLQYFSGIEDPALHRSLVEVLSRVLSSTDAVKNVNKNNAAHAVLFEALSLAMHLEAEAVGQGESERELMQQGCALLGKFIAVREPNIRYLGLENLTRLLQLQIPGVAEAVARHQPQIISSLRDPDVSIRRRALDLLYAMCDGGSARAIVEELLEYLGTADFAIREELALKTAILAERFAPDLSWYVDVVLQLIEKAGDFVSDDVWYRVVQFVTNNEDLQAYAAAKAVGFLDKPAVHETMVKVGGYILGEFSHLLARQPGCSPLEIFTIIHDKFPTVSTPTKALLLSAYAKILMHAVASNVPQPPELKLQVEGVLQKHGSYVDAEVQQRAVEYAALAARGMSAAEVLAEMPRFPERESALLRRAEDTEGDAAEVSATKQRMQVQSQALVVASAAATAPRALPVRLPGGGGAEAGAVAGSPRGQGNGAGPPPAVGSPLAAQAAAPSADLLGDLLGPLALEGPPAGAGAGAPAAGADGAGDSLALALYEAEAGGTAVQPVGSVTEWYRKLCLSDSGVLYEDPYLQLGLKAEWRGPAGRLLLFLGNKHTGPLTGVRVAVAPVPGLRLAVAPVPDNIPPRAQVQCPVDVVAQAPPLDVPVLELSFSFGGGAPVQQRLRLPVPLSKFMVPAAVTPNDFFARWKALPAPPSKLQEVVRGVRQLPPPGLVDLLTSLHVGVQASLDPNPNNLVAASSLFTESAPSGALVLLRIETDPADLTQLRLTVASADPSATLAVKQFVSVEMMGANPTQSASPNMLPQSPTLLSGAAAALAGLV